MNFQKPKTMVSRPDSIIRLLTLFALIIICSLRVAGSFAADTSVVKGELLLATSGLARITECGSNRVLLLGVMASTPYFKLSQSHAEVSEGGKFSVLVEVEGELRKEKSRSSSGEVVIESPKILSITRGPCAGKPPAKR